MYRYLLFFFTGSYAANETVLTALTGYDCGCPGQNASYTCTVDGGVITVWGGTAFNCIGNVILLRHENFPNAIGECNNGAIRGYSIENVDNIFFTSRLDVRLSADLQGRTISCSVDDGTDMIPVGTKTLIVTTPLGMSKHLQILMKVYVYIAIL
jgi:hypothetical protein